jgi:ATP-dependent exoDNAse (exonuclease V) beta subunit
VRRCAGRRRRARRTRPNLSASATVADGAAGPERPSTTITPPGPLDDFEAAPDWDARSHLAPPLAPGDAQDADTAGARSSRRLGILVHRLLERFGVGTDRGDAELTTMVERLIRADERPDVADLQAFASAVVLAYRQLGSNPEVRALYADGGALHELPFTLRTEQGLVRGTIDCLLRRPDGTLVVLEFKTGRARGEHAAQAELYRSAVQALAPGTPVEVRVVYTAESDAQNSVWE